MVVVLVVLEFRLLVTECVLVKQEMKALCRCVIIDMSGAHILPVNYVDVCCNFMVLGSLRDLDPTREAIRLSNYPRCL
jgi:hypothetical protein